MTAPDPLLLALARLDPADRAAFLDRACAGSPDLRQRVEAALAAPPPDPSSFRLTLTAGPPGPDPSAGDPAAPPTVTCSVGPPPRPLPTAGRVGEVLAGRYKLLEALGEGGMGEVWVAEQREPVKRLVAVKVIKAGMDSKAVLARFEAERQALALMDHPNIAKVLDAGAAPDGRPFFVMELVKGVPITTYCDERKLTPRERLELFVPVCQAIQHAHQKGIIHRDVKPSNVLVALYDDRAVPKVIDFGLAKAVTQPLTDLTLHTAVGHVLGTPLYMSPEQATLNNLDVDTRSDVYSLGVLLYELLTGSTPIPRERLGRSPLDEMLRAVREEEPPRPSTRLSTAQTRAGIAAVRRTEPGKLSQMLRGDLDWVVLKALEKDRARRYETANGLARDVQRYLADEPVEARPPSAAYRLRKFARRHRGGVAAVAAVFLALVAGVVGTTWGMVQANKARADEAAQRRLVEKREREATQQERVADSVQRFLLRDILGVPDPADPGRNERRGGGVGKDNPAVRAMLDGAAGGLTPEALATRFPNQWDMQVSVLVTVGEAYRGAGAADRAIEMLDRAARLGRDKLTPDHPAVLNAEHSLAALYWDTRQFADAIALLGRVREGTVKKFGADHPSIVTITHNLGAVYRDAGRVAEALPLFEETVRQAEADRFQHRFAAQFVADLAEVLELNREFAAAEGWRRKWLAVARERPGAGTPVYAAAVGGVGLNLVHQERWAEAEPLLAESVAVYEKANSTGWPAHFARALLGAARAGLGRFPEAEGALAAGFQGLGGADANLPWQARPRIARLADRLTALYAAAGRPADAARWRAEHAKFSAPVK